VLAAFTFSIGMRITVIEGTDSLLDEEPIVTRHLRDRSAVLLESRTDVDLGAQAPPAEDDL
jgi:hypothetical protein